MEESKSPLITVSGPPASGTTTLAEALSDELGFEIISGGDIFRRVAAERGLSLSELTRLSEEDDSIDKELDNRLKQIINDHLSGNREPDGEGLIVESRLAGWHAEGEADVAVYLDAPVHVRLERLDGRDETVDEFREREQSEARRYKDYYGIDVEDTSIYDVTIDTAKNSEDEMVRTVIQKL